MVVMKPRTVKQMGMMPAGKPRPMPILIEETGPQHLQTLSPEPMPEQIVDPHQGDPNKM